LESKIPVSRDREPFLLISPRSRSDDQFVWQMACGGALIRR